MAAVVVDTDTMCVTWHNSLALRLLPDDSGRETLVGCMIGDFIPMADAAGMTAAVAGVASSGDCHHSTLHVVGDKSRRRTLRASAYRLPDMRVLLLATVS